MAIRKRYDGKLLNGAAFYSKILLGEFFLWTCLFKKSVIDEHDIRFIPGCRYMEDAAFMVEYLSHCKWATYMHDVVYRYRIYGATAGQSRKDYTQDMNLIEASIHKMPDSRIKRLFLSEINEVIKKRTKGESGWQIFADKILLNLKYQLCKNK